MRKAFEMYPWPGNVRELEHVIEGAMSLMDGDVLEFVDLPSTVQRHFETVDQEAEVLTLRSSAEFEGSG